MGTFTATAGDDTTIGNVRRGSTRWAVGTANGAAQGAYTGGSIDYSLVGTMVFNGADTALVGKNVRKITLTITSGAYGSEGTKTLTFCKANYQYIPSGIDGYKQIGAKLGTLTGYFYDNTTTHVLSSTSNAEFFNALTEYLKAGNKTLVLYNGETSSGPYSDNYAKIMSITMMAEYMDGSQSVAYQWDGSTWVPMYAYQWNGSAWVPYNIAIHNGSSIEII